MMTEHEQQDDLEAEESEQEELIESPFKRAFMVVFSPRRVYESLLKSKRGRGDWLIPIMISLLVGLLSINLGYDYIRSEQASQTIQSIRNNKSLSDEQKDARIEQTREMMDRMQGVGRILTNVSAVIGIFASTAVIGLVLLFIARMFLSSGLAFKDAFTITALGMMVTAAGSVVQIPLMVLYESFTRSRLSLGLLLPSGMAESFIYKLLNIDLFVALYTIFLGIGLAVFTKKPLSRTLPPLVVLWFLFRIASIGISGMLGSIGG